MLQEISREGIGSEFMDVPQLKDSTTWKPGLFVMT